MAQWYDKIIRENVENVLGKTVFSMLNLNPVRVESLSTSVHNTIKRESNFLKKIWIDEAASPIVIQIEFQKYLTQLKVLSKLVKIQDVVFRRLEVCR
jgi:hypothetical protein